MMLQHIDYKSKTHVLILLIGAFFSLQNNFSQVIQKKDTLYFDKDWKSTTKINHEFYRPIPLKKIDSLLLIQDFYKNGNMQMQGYAYAINENKYAGDTYWYNKDGSDASYSKYINTTNKPLTYYHNNGTVWKTVTYSKDVKAGVIKIYNNKGLETKKEVYKKGVRINDTIDKFTSPYYSAYRNKQIPFNKNVKNNFIPTKALYWMNSGKLASATNYKDKYTISNQKIYAESGELIKEYKQNDFLSNELIDGNYYNVKTTNGFAISIDSTSQISQQHQVVKINNISHVIADKTSGNMEFLKKISSNKYSELNFDLLYKNDSNKISASFISYKNKNSYEYSDDDFYDEDEYTIPINEIKEQSVSQLFESLKSVEWRSNYKEFNNDTINHKTTFKRLNNYIYSYTDEKFTIKKNGGFGSFYKESDNDSKKWRIDDIDFYTVYVFLLNGNKPILILSDEDDIEYYIIPTKNNKFIVNFEDRKDQKLYQQAYSKLTKKNLKKVIQYGDSRNFYSVKTKNKKYYIANSFNEIIITKAYDSVQLKNQYIIGRNKNTIDIYNIKLQKLPVKNIRQVYFDRENLQVLTNNRVFYIDALGNETKRKSISYSFCGTVSSTDFTLLQTKGKKAVNAIKIYYGGMGRGYSAESFLKINNLNTTYSLTFLNKTKNDGYDGNSGFVDGYKNLTDRLVVRKKNKFGLYNYSLEDVNFKHKRDEIGIIDINSPKYGSTNAKELLPVKYDAIELRSPLIIVKLNNAYGIYPLKKGLKYKTLGDVNNNFIPFETLDGKKGWIDVHTHQEFIVK